MDYQCKTRSNYFAIREGREAKLKALLDHCGLHMWKENDPYGVTRYAFGVDGDFVGIPYRGTIPEEDPDGCGGDRNAFFRELQAVISEDDAVIIQEVGTEALRYFMTEATIVTSKEVQFISLQKMAVREAAEMLSNPRFTTRLDY